MGARTVRCVTLRLGERRCMICNRRVIESYVIGKPGVKRCVRMINLESLDRYIRDPKAAEARAARDNGSPQNGGGGNTLGTL
jgi:hypothetical protein